MGRKILVSILILVFVIGALPAFMFAEDQSISLAVTIRDFEQEDKLFNGTVYDTEKLVRTQLGSDRKPIFSDPNSPTNPISQWQKWATFESPVTLSDLHTFFNNTPLKNLTTTQQLTLIKDKYGYYSSDMRTLSTAAGYFPIDNMLFGNEGKAHNYQFTLEHHSGFTYKGTENFTFAGDGDVWIFINGRLVIDMGGVHDGLQSTISLPDLVKNGELNIKKGDYVPFDFFFMERHTRQSDLFIKTNIDLIKFKTSAWALPEVDKADRFDLLPPSLKYADMTKNITREEFTELVVRLYEKTLNEVIFPLKPNPFKDTENKDIVKALTLGFTTGTSATIFSPGELINREQVASMLSRTIRIMFPKGDYSKAGAPTFKDQKDISAWALEHALFVSKNGILMGTDGKFMPKGVTSAQKAAGYANTTHEQAVAMCVRIFVKYK